MGHDVESDYEVCGSVVFFLFFFFNSQDGLADKLDAILNLVCLRKYCFYVAFVVELVCNKNNGLNLLWILSP